MKDFMDLGAKPPKPLPAKTFADKYIRTKRAWALSLDRAAPVKQALEDWLLSFNGGMTKKDFQAQLCKLHSDDAKAIKQLEESKGKRVIRQAPRDKPPKLEIKLITALAQYKMIAIEGKSGKNLIDNFLSTLSPAGVYILDVNELILEYVDYQHRGKAGEIIEAANRADVLIIEGLEKPISLAYHIKDTLYQLAAVRKKDKDKYTVSTWNYTHAWYISEYAEIFTHFSA